MAPVTPLLPDGVVLGALTQRFHDQDHAQNNACDKDNFGEGLGGNAVRSSKAFADVLANADDHQKQIQQQDADAEAQISRRLPDFNALVQRFYEFIHVHPPKVPSRGGR